MTGVLIKKGNLGTEITSTQGEHDIKMNGEIGAMHHLQAKEW